MVTSRVTRAPCHILPDGDRYKRKYFQGVEANLDLASKKLFEFRDTVQTPFVTKEYRIPGKHLMSEDQFEDYIRYGEYSKYIIYILYLDNICVRFWI